MSARVAYMSRGTFSRQVGEIGKDGLPLITGTGVDRYWCGFEVMFDDRMLLNEISVEDGPMEGPPSDCGLVPGQ